LHCRNGVLPDANLGMEDESDFLKYPNQFTAKVSDSNVSVSLFARRKIHTVKTHVSARHQNAIQFLCDKLKLLVKLRMRPAITEIPLAV